MVYYAARSSAQAISANQYQIEKSLRFRASASAYLSRTFGAATNAKIWTLSLWAKLGSNAAGTYGIFGGAQTIGSSWGGIEFDASTSQIYIRDYNGSTNDYLLTATAARRDYSAHGHLVVKMDTTQVIPADRLRMYWNGVECVVTGSFPGQNSFTRINNNQEHRLMRYMGGAAVYYDGYLSEVNFIDGQALTPDYLGTWDSTGTVWLPKKYTGQYGNNGFYLPFTDAAQTVNSNIGLGKDFSGRGNYWVTNGITVDTNSVNHDSMNDSPTNNFAVGNTLAIPAGVGSMSYANMRYTRGDAYGLFRGTGPRGTIGVNSGKWYFEATVTQAASSAGTVFNMDDSVGVVELDANNDLGVDYAGSTKAWSLLGNMNKANGSQIAYGSTPWTVGCTLGVAFDLTAGKIWFAVDNTWQASGNPVAGTGEAFSNLAGKMVTGYIACYHDATGLPRIRDINFGQRPFKYVPPQGFKALCTDNLNS